MLEKFAPIKALLTLIKAQKEYSMRELARNAKIGVGTAKQCLDWLLNKRIIKRKIIGKTHQYSLDLNNVVTRYIKILISLDAIQESGIIEEIKNKLPVTSIVLYGSIARGDDELKSDVDLLLISRKDIKIKPLRAEKNLGKEVTIICYTLAEWRRKAKEDKPFYDRIITEGIPLYGELPVVS